MAGIGGDSIAIATAKQAVDRIVHHIETQFRGFNISEILKAGSLGDGTAVTGEYDIDLVVYSRGFTGRDVLRSPTMFKPWMSPLKAFIEQFPGVEIIHRGEHASYYSVEFHYQMYRGVSIDVDLLVSPYWSSQHEFYNFLRDVPRADRVRYSVCASKWQREFFRKPEYQDAKEYIRRAKAWRNSVWGRSVQGKPKSYLISLLVVRAYENTVVRDAYSVTQALKALVKKERKDEFWADKPGDFYTRSDYPDLLPSRPRIIDPANPANNVWETGFTQGGPHILTCKINTIDLSRPII